MRWKERILLVTSDLPYGRTVGAHLESAGFEVFYAGNGAEGLCQVPTLQPAVVVLGSLPPELDAYTTCQRLREFSDIPIILLVPQATEEDVLRGFRAGADDCVSMPLRVAELVARVQALLRRMRRGGNGSAPNIQVYGDLIVDLTRRQVIVQGKLIPLTPTEFRLLSCLVQNAGDVVPHQALLSQVWGPACASELQYLKLYIRYLRRKIEPDPAQPRYIITVRGVGYQLNPMPPV